MPFESNLIIIAFSLIYGITMKLADLFDEHGLKEWFKGCAIVFGILWGLFGSLLLVSNSLLANIILAQVLGFIVRMRIDYRNHAIATVMIIIAFIFFSELNPWIFSMSFIFFTFIGSLREVLTDSKRMANELLADFFEYCGHYVLFGIFLGWYAHSWTVFYVFLFYSVSYNAIRIMWDKKIWLHN